VDFPTKPKTTKTIINKSGYIKQKMFYNEKKLTNEEAKNRRGEEYL
jgi:hypothetical protein